ncbi:DNRLRE domain-containing protein [Microbispora bryophytorum]|uniref:DNRLRE domain-containing protein n=1 Tax=Microbispora bryophytorum TaxID=1460882 RepID=UPI0033CE294E
MPISRARKLLSSTIRGRLSRAWVGAVVALGVFVAGVGVPDGLVQPAAADASSPSSERSVDGRPVRVKSVAKGAEDLQKPVKRPAPVWPKAGAGQVDLSKGKGAAAVAGLPVSVAPVEAPDASTMATATPVPKPTRTPKVAPAPTPRPTVTRTPAHRPMPTRRAMPRSKKTATPTSETRRPPRKSPSSVQVETFDNAVARRLGGVGLAVRLTRGDGGTDAAPARVAVDYSSFRNAYAGGFASRLTLKRVPACMLESQPSQECVERAKATTRTLPVVNDVVHGKVTAVLDADPAPAAGSGVATAGAAGDASVYVLAASAASTASDATGSFAATDLKPSGTWQVGLSGGDFSYSYPLPAVPAPGGSAPGLALQYSSSSVDSLTSYTNNQASVAGLGWELNAGFIERQFVPCGAYEDRLQGHLCWESPDGTASGSALTLSVGGRSSQIVRDSDSGTYKTADDFGWKIQYVTSGGQSGQPYWKVTDQDGTVYRFGYHRDSSWQVPVLGDDSGEPCHSAFVATGSSYPTTSAFCDAPWRWQLDQEVDVKGNVIDYSYERETNTYCRAGGTVCHWVPEYTLDYDRGGYLSEVTYGHNVNVTGSVPTGRITFGVEDRGTPPDGITDWEDDTPTDLLCQLAQDCGSNGTATFFTSKRLDTVTTSSWNATTWEDVSRLELSYSWIDSDCYESWGDVCIGKPVLWLDKIRPVGMAGSGSDIKAPSVDFTATLLDNRVDYQEFNTDKPRFQLPRISAVTTGLGGVTEITYGQVAPCDPDMRQWTDIWDTNIFDCYGMEVYYYTLGEDSPIYENGGVYNKWLVTQTVEWDLVAGSPDQVTRYEYQGEPAWALPLQPFYIPHECVGDSYMLDDLGFPTCDENWPGNWSEFRGYDSVQVTKGSGTNPADYSTTTSTFYRGMADDILADGTTKQSTVTDFDGNAYYDGRELAGQTLQEQTFSVTALTSSVTTCSYPTWKSSGDYGEGDRVSYQKHHWEALDYTLGLPPDWGYPYWEDLGPCPTTPPGPKTLVEDTSTRYEYDPVVTGSAGWYGSIQVNQIREVTREKATSGWRYSETATEYNDDGLPKKVNDYGERGVGSDNTCTAITYARNTSKWLINYEASEERHAGDDCSSGTLLARSITLYDGATSPSANTPTRGDATEIRAYSSDSDYTATKSTFDNYGRPLSSTDPLNKTTTMTYAPAVGWPSGGVTVTNPLGQTVTTWSSPYNGQPVGMRDANNNDVNIDYDALGRTLQMWTPDAPKSGNTPAAKVAYAIPTDSDGVVTGPAKTTVSRLQSGRGTSAKWVSTHTYVDGLGRPREVQTASPAGGRIVQVTTYDARGLTAATSAPAHNTAQPGSGLLNPDLESLPQWSTAVYDSLGRTTAQIDKSGPDELRHTTTKYLGADKYEVTPPVGGKTVYYTDAADQVTKIEEWLTGTGTAQQTAIAGPTPSSSAATSPAAAGKTETAKSSTAVTPHASAANAPAAKESPAQAQTQVQDARIQASVEAKRSGKPVEVAGLTSATSSTVANPDGKTFTTTVSTRPARVKRDGAWVPIDTSLVEKDGALVPKAGPAVTVSAGGDGPFATVADEAGNSIALSWPSPLLTPTVERNKARYADAAGPGADLVVTVLPGGVRHDIELRERPATQLNYRINVKTSGWKLQQDGQGRLTVTDSAGKLVAPVAQPVMYPKPTRPVKAGDTQAGTNANAKADARPEAKDRHRRTGRIATRLVREGDHQVLELTPDASFLADPTLTYPVTVDPTVDFDTQDDTYVADYDSDIHAGDYEIWTGSYHGDLERGYVYFDTSSLWGETVTQAQLSLRNHYSTSCGSTGAGIQVRRVIADWDPYSISWSSQPDTTTEDAVISKDGYDVDSCPAQEAGQVTWNVTAMAQDWAAGQPGYGVSLRSANESAYENWRSFDSSEAWEWWEDAAGPILTVTYAASSAPTVGNLSITPVTGSAASSLTPTLHATVSDIASGSLRADYQVEHDPAYTTEGTGQIWTGSSAGVTSGNDAPAVVPAGKLSDGWHIRWRARATNTGTSVSSAWSSWQTTTVNVPDPLVDQLQVTPSQLLSGETLTSTLTPALGARVTTPDAGASRVEFELEHDPADTAHGTGSIWTIGGAQAAAAKSAAAITAPASAPAAGAASPANTSPTPAQVQAQVQGSRSQAAAEAKRSGKPVEVAGLTTTTSSTVANPDGKTFTTTVSTRPARVKRDGAWVPIDTTLTEQGGALAPKAGPAVTVSNGGDGPFVTLADEAGNSIALSWPTPLPKPTVERNRARYTDAAGPGADLVVTVLPSGIRHDIELRERPTTQLNYRIGVKTTGWKLQQDGQGRLTLTDSAGKLVAPVAQPVMYPQLHRSDAKTGEDATSGAGTTVKANKGHGARSGRIATHLTDEGDHQVLELAPDAAFLADPATSFPVVVDPTVNLDTQGDTFVGNWDPYSSWWDEELIDVGSWTPGSGDIEISRGYLQFDTSALVGKSVTQAQLSLFNYAAPQCGSFGSGIQARRVTSTWDAYTITWNSQPYTTSEDAVIRQDAYDDYWCPDGNGGTITYDITAMAQDWAAGKPQYGVQLRAVDESGVGDWRDYDSIEATRSGAQPPTLTATYSLPSSSPTVGNPSITPVTGGAVSSLTPTLHATVSDTASGSLRADYEVEHDPAYTAEGTGQIWTGSSAGVTSGNDAPAVVPAGKLSNGWHIRWRARATNTGTSTSSAWSNWQTATITTVLDPVVDNVASGTQATLTVPAGKLADGWKVRWRARAVAAGSNTSAWSDWQALMVKVPAATVSQLQITPAETVDGKTAVSSLTPQLLATVTDAYGQPLRAEFELEHDPADTGHGTGGIWTGAADNVASGTQASVTVPGGALSNGWGIRWRARAVNTTTQVTSAWSDWQIATVNAANVPSEPGVNALQITPSQVVDDTTVATSLTPQLRAQVTNPAGGTMRAEFELEHDPAAPEGQGTGQIWTTAVDDVPAGTQTTVTIPADTMSEGWLVRWRARAIAGETASSWSDWQTARVDQPDPVLGTLQVTPSEVVDGKTTSASLTPQLLAQVTDPAGGKVRAEFELEHDPAAPEGQGTGGIWTTAVDDVASGAQATVTVPDGKLNDSWLVRWRARAVTAGGTSAWSDWQQLTVTEGSLIPVIDNPRTRPANNGTTTTLTPALLATVRSDQGGQLGAEFEVEHDPADTQHGTGQIWTTSVNGVTSGNDATATIPAGTLSNGWKVRWRARAVKNGIASDWTAWQSVTVSVPNRYDTTFEYDRDGQLIKQVDANGNVRTFTYDLLGRRTASHDPDAGDSQQAYDDAGRLLWSTNGKGQKVSYSYDDIGRQTALWAGEEKTGTKLAEWVYDTATGGKGQLTSATRYAGGNAYVDTITGYDAMSRPTGSTLTIPSFEGLLAGTYTFATTYTTSGQVATYTMPAAGGLPAETLTSTYTDLDLPSRMTSGLGGGFTYVDSTTYSDTELPTDRAYGAGGKIKRHLNWDPKTGWVTSVTTTTKADTSGPVTVQDDRYDYDLSGEITKILDAAAASGGSTGQYECFTYDGLHRLSQAWTTTASACGTGTATADNQGIDPYAQSYAYDGVGNLTSLTSNGQAAIYDYPQPGTDAVRPNAVTSISRPTGTGTYAYDDAGQLTSRTVGGKAGTFAWNELGQLDKATIDGQDTTMVYDADGERLIRRGPGGKTTLYLGSMEVEVNGSAITGKRYYTNPDGATVAMRTGGDGVTWLTSGLHGSTQLAVDDTTGKVSRERYLPFGQRRGPDDLPFTDHGFLGKTEDDSTGLDYLSARYYDPTIAKFITTDPLLDLRTPQWANPYAYAGNNPIGLSDPTGLSPAPRGAAFDSCTTAAECKVFEKCKKQHTAAKCTEAVSKKARQAAIKAATEKAAAERAAAERKENDRKAAETRNKSMYASCNSGGGYPVSCSGPSQQPCTSTLQCVTVYSAAAVAAVVVFAPVAVAVGPEVGAGFVAVGSAVARAGAGRTLARAGVDDLAAAAKEPIKGGLTRAGRALQKHGDTSPGNIAKRGPDHVARYDFGKVNNNQRNEIADEMIDEILTNPRAEQSLESASKHYGGIIRDIKIKGGWGARWSMRGGKLHFEGFL